MLFMFIFVILVDDVYCVAIHDLSPVLTALFSIELGGFNNNSYSPGHDDVNNSYSPGHADVNNSYSPGHDDVNNSYSPGHDDVNNSYSPGHDDVNATHHLLVQHREEGTPAHVMAILMAGCRR